jgi:hypothetical protein
MTDTRWQELYKAAVLETDRNKLEERVKMAEDAMRARMALDGEIPGDERTAIQEALSALRTLKQESEQSTSPIVQGLSLIEEDAGWWNDAAQYCENFAGSLTEEEKTEWQLLAAVYRERVKIHRQLAGRMRD